MRHPLRQLAGSSWGAGATTLRISTLALVHSTAENYSTACDRIVHTHIIGPVCHERRFANCDWMPTSYTSGQSFCPPGHPTC